MQQTVSISNDHWDSIDKDAESLRMNRSQFIDFVYNFWRDTQQRGRRIRVTINFVIIFLLFMIILLLFLVR